MKKIRNIITKIISFIKKIGKAILLFLFSIFKKGNKKRVKVKIKLEDKQVSYKTNFEIKNNILPNDSDNELKITPQNIKENHSINMEEANHFKKAIVSSNETTKEFVRKGIKHSPINSEHATYKEEQNKDLVMPIINNKEEIKSIIENQFRKELKIEKMYQNKIETKLMLDIEQKIEEKIIENELDTNILLEEAIKIEIKKYFIENIKNGKIKEYEIDKKVKEYIEKIIKENQRITLESPKEELEEPILKDNIEDLNNKEEVEYEENNIAEENKEIINNLGQVENIEIVKEELPVKEIKEPSNIIENKTEEKDKTPKTQEKEIEQKHIERINLQPFNIIEEKLERSAFYEMQKEDIEDKEYENLENQIEALLIELSNLKKKNINENTKKEIKRKEAELQELQKNISKDKEKTIENERQNLEEKITLEEINGLKQEVNKLYLEHQIEEEEIKLSAENIKIESRNRTIKKTLLISKIKKANIYAHISNLFALPFIRNKYFYYLTSNVLVHHELNMFNQVLNNQKLEDNETELDKIELGSDALEEAIYLTNKNTKDVEELLMDSILKYPELKNNQKFMKYGENLRKSLMKTENKLLKKQKALEKYHIKNINLIRKLKKEVN